MGADDSNPEEQQRRELEEIRRSFTEIGVRMGSLFEPAQQNGKETPEAGTPEAGTHDPKAPRPRVRDAQVPRLKARGSRAPKAKALEPKAPEPKALEPRAPKSKASDVQAPESKAPDVQAPEPEAREAEPPAVVSPAVVSPPAGRQGPGWAVAAAVAAACLLAGSGLGYLLHPPSQASGEPAPTVITPKVPETQTRTVVPPSCLDTARLGDQTIDLLLRNVRDHSLSLTFKAYTEASQTCRKEASP